LDQVRRQVEQCDSIEGLIIHSGLASGTGSGLMALMLERLAVDIGRKKNIISNLLYASNCRMVNEIVEPYNVVLCTGSLLEHSNMIITNTNLGLANHCKSQLNIEIPGFKELNMLNTQGLIHLVGSYIYGNESQSKL
jgi:tubulin alpha